MRLRRMNGAMRGRLLKNKQQDWRWKRFKEQHGLCFYCETEMVLEMRDPVREQKKLCTLDHKTPLSRGGVNHWENSAAACHHCNQWKRNMTAEEFRAYLKASAVSGDRSYSDASSVVR